MPQISLEPDMCCEHICFEVEDYAPMVMTDLPDYSGATTVTPSMDAQTLETANTALHENITIEAIPYDEVEAATPVISVDNGGKVTATTNQQGGIVESSTKSAEYQQTIIEQATPDISVASDGVITATATQAGGFVAGGTKTATLAQETVEQATPTISVDNAGKITASATQTAGFVAAGTKSAELQQQTVEQATPSISVANDGTVTAEATQTAGFVAAGTKSDSYSLPTQAADIITPTESAQTAVAAGKWTTGIVQVSAIPSEYIKPSGTLPITQNGTYDVKSYANTSVSVPGIVPTGTLPISANGTYDVTNYASANVGVPIIETEAITITENGVYTASSGHAYTPVTVNVTGGASSYQFLASAKFTVTQDYDTRVELGTFSISPYNPMSSGKLLVFITRRDDFAITQQTEYYGNDAFYYTAYGANGETAATLSNAERMFFSYCHNVSKWDRFVSGANSFGGVMPSAVDSDGTCHISARYLSGYGHIVGTYTVYAYSLDFPDGLIPFTV